MKLAHHKIPDNQYYPEVTDKSQIVLHHTVSGPGADGDINWWLSNPEHIATCVIISRDGTVNTLFRSKYWAHHIGVKYRVFNAFGISPYGANKSLNKASIGIELDSWGGVIKKDGKYYREYGKEISKDEVIDYGVDIRGFRYYEKYTREQISSLKALLIYWGKNYNIPLQYNALMWSLNEQALSGCPGVWSHVSFRPDKSDCHPQPSLINMLKSL